MGRPKIEIEPELIYEMSSRGATIKEMADVTGVCTKTLSRRMAELKLHQGLLLKYRSLQTLELTALQARVLNAITPEKIESASLIDLARAFSILKKAELGIEGKPSGAKGLLHFLLQLEEEEKEEREDGS